MTSQDNILYIKNMVCDRCCMVVSEVFSALGLEPVHVELGKVELAEPPAIAVQTAGPVARETGYVEAQTYRQILEYIGTRAYQDQSFDNFVGN